MMGEKLTQNLKRHRTGRLIHRIIDNLDRHHGPVAASAIAFDAFLSLVPLTAIAGYVFGYLHETGDIVLNPIIKTAPIPVRALVVDSFRRLSAADAAALAPISFGAFLWVSSGGISTAMYVFEMMFESPPRPWWLRRLMAMACIIGSVAIIAALVAVAFVITSISGSLGAFIVAVALPVAVVLGMLAAFFRIAIHGPRPHGRRVFPGAVVTVSLWTIASTLFSLYVSTLARYATLYGGLAAVAIFLFWLWLLALSLLAGGEVNAQLEGIRRDALSSAALENQARSIKRAL